MSSKKKSKASKKSKNVGGYKLSDMLATPAPKTNRTIEPDSCVLCNVKLTALRIDALRSMHVPVNNWTCTKDSTTKRVLGQYMGEVGTSEMKIVDRIEEVSVRSMFRKSTSDDDAEASETEPATAE